MKKFVRKTLTLSLIILMLIAAGEIYVRSLPNPARYKHQWLLVHSAEVETLILGSSHTFYGINSAQLGSHTFNLAQPTQPYRYDWYELTHYPLPRLKTLVLPFSYQSLFEDIDREPQLRYWAVRYRLYMDCDLHSPLSEYGFECLHPAPFKEKLSSLWRKSQLSWDSLGNGTSYGTTSLLLQGKDNAKGVASTRSNSQAKHGVPESEGESVSDNGLQRARENTYWQDSSMSISESALPLNISFLDSIATWCERRAVRLLLVTTPTTQSFRLNCNQLQTNINDSVLQAVLQRHPTIEYRNYWADTAFTAADFYDADHLNRLGAHKLTQKIIKDFSLNNKQ